MKGIYYTLIFYILIILKTIAFALIFSDIEGNFTIDNVSFIEIISLFLFAGIIETLLTNLLLYHLFSKIDFVNQYKIIIVILASIIFGFLHFSSFDNIKSPISSFISGIFYNTNFIIYYHKYKSYFKASLSTFLLHLFHNITIYTIDYFYM